MAHKPPVRAIRAPLPTPSTSQPQPLEQQVANLNAQFDLLKAQVRQAQQLSTLGTASAMIAHEVSNLLTPIVSYATAALETTDAALKEKALTVTLQNAQMLIAMSERMLAISAAKPPERKTVGLKEAVENAVASLCRDLAKDGINLRIGIDGELAVLADELQLQQVFFNLFLNAREAMVQMHSGRLAIVARHHDDHVVIEVNNTGDPIPPEILPHVFEPFQSSKPAVRGGKNRCGGLGLALCRDLVRENEGTIEVSSDSASGTTFRITLPAAPTPV